MGSRKIYRFVFEIAFQVVARVKGKEVLIQL